MMLDSFQGGEICVDDIRYPREDERVRDASARIRPWFGMVFQSFNLFPHMSVLRNITHAPMRVLGMTHEKAEGHARELLQMVKLEDKADAFPDDLSGGQKQRIAIARSLAMQPRIMLFDEPTSALDPELVNEVLGIIRLLTYRQSLTNIIVTHEIGFAMEVSQKVCFLDKGRIIEQGPSRDVLANPQDARTRQFLGLLSNDAQSFGHSRPEVAPV